MVVISKQKQTLLTADEARRLLSYDHETGELRRKTSTSGMGMKVGDIAGDIFHNGQKSYWRVYIKNARFVSHRVIWLIVTGDWPENEIDHINGDGTDNRWSNLRSVTRSENFRNRRRQSNNSSGKTGVHWCRTRLRWIASIRIDGKQKGLGYFEDKDEAIAARTKAEREHGYHPLHGAERTI